MRQENSQIGYLYGIVAACSYGVMSFLVHYNPAKFLPEQLVFQRGIFCIFALLPFCYRELSAYFRKDSGMLWIRCIAGSLAVLFYFYALQGTASANANLLFSSTPIYVGLLSWILLREKISRSEMFGIFLIVLGNIFLYIPSSNPIPLWVGFTGSIGALFTAIAYLSLGELTKTHSPAMIVFGFSVVSLVLSLLYPGKVWIPVDRSSFLFVFSVAALGLIAQVSSTLSFAYLKSPVATALGRSSIIFSGILDIWIASFKPGAFEIAAYIVVILGVYVVHHYKVPRQKVAQIDV